MGRGGDIIKTIQNESGAQIKVKKFEKLSEIIRRFNLADDADAVPLMFFKFVFLANFNNRRFP